MICNMCVLMCLVLLLVSDFLGMMYGLKCMNFSGVLIFWLLCSKVIVGVFGYMCYVLFLFMLMCMFSGFVLLKSMSGVWVMFVGVNFLGWILDCSILLLYGVCMIIWLSLVFVLFICVLVEVIFVFVCVSFVLVVCIV